MRLLLVLTLLLALPAAASAQITDPTPPSATTEPASAVGRTTATLEGTVDPNGSATTYRFEYGTTSAYGLQTPARDAGEGDGDVAAQAPVERLSPDTTYHFRIVATNGNGTSEGEDRTFRTAANPPPPPPRVNPRPPGVTRTGAGEIRPDSALLRSRIDPNDGATTYHFEFGRTRAYGWTTPERDLGSGDGGVPVTEQLSFLEPFRRYHFRLVATNEAGRTFSKNRSFVTSRVLSQITLELEDVRSPWGEGTEVYGRVSGTGARGTPVALERQDFPFAGPFSSIGTPFPVRAGRGGRFRMFVPALFSTTRLRAVTRTATSVVSPTVTAHVALRVGAAARRLSRKRMRLRGSVQPAAPEGRATLQRRTSRGGWTFVRSGRLRPLSGDRSRYTFKVARKRVTRRYRVRVIARDGGAHVPGNSRSIKVKKLPKKRR